MKAQRTGASQCFSGGFFFGFLSRFLLDSVLHHKLPEGYEIWSDLKLPGSEYCGTNKQMKSDEKLN